MILIPMIVLRKHRFIIVVSLKTVILIDMFIYVI